MKLSELKQIKRAESAIVGEHYTINGFTLKLVPDRYNDGEDREVVILSTDKGNVYAPTSFARAIIDSISAGEDVYELVNGCTVVCKEIYSKRAGRMIKIFEFC